MNYFLILSILSFSAFGGTSEPSPGLVIRISTPEEKIEVSRILKTEKLAIKAEGEKFFLVSPVKSERILTRIRSVSSKIVISEDEYSVPQVDLTALSCELDPVTEIIPGISQLVQSCAATSPRCQNQSLDWAPKSMGADLADEIVRAEITNSGGSSSLSRTAVIDTGFDVEKQASGLLVPVTTAIADTSSRDANSDEGGHGTNVAGMIAGRHTGVTAHTELSVYKISKGREGKVANGIIAAAIEKACKDNNDVVNVSWGSAKDEMEEINPREELWYEVASRLGCLVIKSAGNSGIRRKRGSPSIAITDPFLTVSALDDFDELASFSTSGQVAAPGAGVFSLLSSEHIYGENTRNKSCSIGGQNYGPINGTSFSSPAVAGVAAQVISILRARGEIPASPSEKIQLVKSILIASQNFPERRNGINSYGAALIAKSVSKNNANSSIDELVTIGRTSASGICQSNLECPGTNCEGKNKCVEGLRRKSFACVLTLPEKEMLVKNLHDLGEMNLVAGWAGKFTDAEISGSAVLRGIFSTTFFNDILENASNIEERAYLLTTPTFQRRPEWEGKVRELLNNNRTPSVASLILSDRVKEMPEWSTWIKNVLATRTDQSSKDYLLDPRVQTLPEYEEWLVRYLERNDFGPYRIDILRDPAVQNNPRWKDWVKQYLQEPDQLENFLSLPEVRTNGAWEELANFFWSNAGSPEKISFLRNPAIQDHPSWENIARRAFADTSDANLLGFVLATPKTQSLPDWEATTVNFMNRTSSSNEFLLTEPAVQRLSGFNSWVENFFRQPEISDYSMARVLQNPGIKNHPAWPAQVQNYMAREGSDYYKVQLLSDPAVQQLPEWNTWIDARFERPVLRYDESVLLKNLKNNPRWPALTEIFLAKAEPSFMASILLDPDAQRLPGHSAGVSRFVRTSTDGYAVQEYLTREDVSSSPQWTKWVREYFANPVSSEGKLLTESFVLRHPEWPDLSRTFLAGNSEDSHKENFLSNEYVQQRPEWRSMAEQFLRNCQDPDVLERFRLRPEIQELERAQNIN